MLLKVFENIIIREKKYELICNKLMRIFSQLDKDSIHLSKRNSLRGIRKFENIRNKFR